MKSTVVKASLRNDAGRKISNSLRRQGLVPAIVYGGEEQVLVQIDERQFKNIVYTPNVYLIDLDVEGTTYKTILQDIQFHPVTDKITHADFLLISEDKPVIISIPVNSVGTSKGVVAGGKLNINRRKLKVKALPSALPDSIELDITPLKIGDSIKVKEVKVNGLELLDPKSDVVLAVKATRTSARGGDDDDEEEAATAEAETESAEA
jgi:large subunit ribosomal protein L25